MSNKVWMNSDPCRFRKISKLKPRPKKKLALPGHTTHHQEHTRNPSLVTQTIIRSTRGIPSRSHNQSLGAHEESLPDHAHNQSLGAHGESLPDHAHNQSLGAHGESLPGHTTNHQEHTRNPSLDTQPIVRSPPSLVTQPTTRSTRRIPPWSHNPLSGAHPYNPSPGAHEESLPGHTTHHQEHTRNPSLVTQPITRSTRGIPPWSHNPSLGAHKESLPGHTTHHQEHTRNPSLVTQPMTRSTRRIPSWSHNP